MRLQRENTRLIKSLICCRQGKVFPLVVLLLPVLSIVYWSIWVKNNSISNDNGIVISDGGASMLKKAVEDDFALATHESLGFMTNIPSEDWQLMKERVHNVYPNTINAIPASKMRKRPQNMKANRFFQENYEPNFACRHEQRIGRRGDGGKWVCDPYRLKQHKNSTTEEKNDCLVYSVGSNGDTTFEEGVRRDIGNHCEIHTFDMADYSKPVTRAGAIFHQWGISHENSIDKRGQKFKTLKDTVEELGHSGRTINIFKIDCEGCEWNTFPSFFSAGVTLQQILIELHSVGDALPHPETFDFFDTVVDKEGYVIFHKEVNIQFWHFRNCIEYGFVKLHSDFFNVSSTTGNANSS